MARDNLAKGLLLITGLLTCIALTIARPLQADEPFDYFRNSWSIIGLKDYNHGARITPQNELVIGDDTKESSTIQILFGRQLTLLSGKPGRGPHLDCGKWPLGMRHQRGKHLRRLDRTRRLDIRQQPGQYLRRVDRWRPRPDQFGPFDHTRLGFCSQWPACWLRWTFQYI